MLFIFRDLQPIILKGLCQNRKIEAKPVVRHYLLVFDKWFHQMPNLLKCWRIRGKCRGNAMDVGKPVPVEIIGRLHQNTEFIGNQPILYPHQPNLADAVPFVVRSFKIYCRKCIHKGIGFIVIFCKGRCGVGQNQS